MFRTLTRGRGSLYADISLAAFEAACHRHFRTVRSMDLADTHRTLYLMEKDL
jgi:hypothetical protein